MEKARKYPIVAERCKKARTAKGYTFEDVYQGTNNVITASLLSDLENEKSNRKVNHEIIITLARFYGVSADYLLGITDTASLDEDIQQAAKTTGLSGDAIEVLSMMQDQAASGVVMRTIQMLNMILEDTRRRYLLNHKDNDEYILDNNILHNMLEYCEAYTGSVELLSDRGEAMPFLDVNGHLSFMPLKECYLAAGKDWIIKDLEALATRSV